MNLIKRTDVLREIHYILNCGMGKEKSLRQIEHHVKEHCEAVDAIPVEWIAQWAEKHEHTNAYSIVDVRNMINEWRQENESDHKD